MPIPAETSHTILQTSWDASTNDCHTVSDPGWVGTQEFGNVLFQVMWISCIKVIVEFIWTPSPWIHLLTSWCHRHSLHMSTAPVHQLLASPMSSILLGLSPRGRRVRRLLLASRQYWKFHSNGDNSLRWNGTVGSRSPRKNALVSARLFTGPPCVPLPVRQALPAHYGVMKSCPPPCPSFVATCWQVRGSASVAFTCSKKK